MKTLIPALPASLIMAIGLGINTAYGAGSSGFRFIGCELGGGHYTVASSTNPNDFGRDCEAVINELVSDGFRIESEVTPGGFSTVVYRMARPGRN